MGNLASGVITQIIISFVVVGLLTIGLIWFLRRTLFGQSRAKQAASAELQATGSKARAMILAVQPTGMVVNHIYIRSNVRFRLEPLDGTPSFEVDKTIMLAQTSMPRVGDQWPAWFDPANPQHCAVAQVNALTSDQIPMFREFGIPHPLDSQQPPVPPQPAPPAAPTPPPEPPSI